MLAALLVLLGFGQLTGPPVTALPVEALVFGALLGGVLLLGLIQVVLWLFGERWASLGLERERLRAVFGWGLLAMPLSYAAAALAMAVYALVADLDLRQLATERNAALRAFADLPLAAVVPLAALIGIYEEIVFRGFFLSRLRAALSSDPSDASAAIGAVVLSSGLFALGHLYQSGLGVVQTFAMGLVLGTVAVKRGNVWPCVVAHAGINSIGLTAIRFV